jgi:hypothetical protein
VSLRIFTVIDPRPQCLTLCARTDPSLAEEDKCEAATEKLTSISALLKKKYKKKSSGGACKKAKTAEPSDGVVDGAAAAVASEGPGEGSSSTASASATPAEMKVSATCFTSRLPRARGDAQYRRPLAADRRCLVHCVPPPVLEVCVTATVRARAPLLSAVRPRHL